MTTKDVEMDITPVAARFNKWDSRGSYQWMGWGWVIRDLRKLMGMNQGDFGSLIGGYTRGKINRYENHQTEPPLEFWVKLMRAFGLNLNWALTGIGRPYIDLHFAECEERVRVNGWQDIRRRENRFRLTM